MAPRIVRLKPDTTEVSVPVASAPVVSGFRRTLSAIAGSVSSTSSILFHDAMPRCSILVTQPNAIIGQLSIADRS